MFTDNRDGLEGKARREREVGGGRMGGEKENMDETMNRFHRNPLFRSLVLSFYPLARIF